MRYPSGFASPMVNDRLAGAGKSRTRLQEARQMRDEQDGEKGFALSIPLAVGIRWCPEEALGHQIEPESGRVSYNNFKSLGG